MFRNAKIIGVGVNSDDYHSQTHERGTAEFFMSPSSLKTFNECPSRWKAGYAPPDSDSKEWGNLIDCLLLTPDQFKLRYAIKPATYPADGKKGEPPTEKPWNGNSTWCCDWVESQGSKCVISRTELETSTTAVKRLLADETIAEILDKSQKQVHLAGEWHDAATGIIVPVQCLIDIVPNGDSPFQKSLCDLKTTRNAGQRAFAKWCYSANYHVQGAFDIDLFTAATQQDRTDWLFVVQENYPPFEIGRRLLSQDFIGIGRQTYQHALARYAKCLKTGLWPQYDVPEEFSLVVPEPWMEFAAIQDKLEDDATDPYSDDADIIP